MARPLSPFASRAGRPLTFADVPVGGHFYLRNGAVLYVKTGGRRYRSTTAGIEYTIGRLDATVRRPRDSR